MHTSSQQIVPQAIPFEPDQENIGNKSDEIKQFGQSLLILIKKNTGNNSDEN